MEGHLLFYIKAINKPENMRIDVHQHLWSVPLVEALMATDYGPSRPRSRRISRRRSASFPSAWSGS